MGVLNAPPREDVFILWAQYGALGGAIVQPRARMWLTTDTNIPDPDIPIHCIVAWNSPSGAVIYETHEIAAARIRPNNTAEVHLADGRVLTFITAPCVCGAGAVGNAMPQVGRISLTYVNPYDRTRLTFTG